MLAILEKKLAKKQVLLKDSLNCTFIACPCTGSSKAPNMQLIFTLRKKIIELRDLSAIQECEIVSMRNSVKFVKVRDLMVEIEALRQLADGKTDPEELETVRRQLLEANEKIERMERSRADSGERERWMAERKELLDQINSYGGQLNDLSTKDSNAASMVSEKDKQIKSLQEQLDNNRKQAMQDKTALQTSLRALEDELRLIQSRGHIAQEELSRLRA